MRRCCFAGDKTFKNDEKWTSYVCRYRMRKLDTSDWFIISGSQIVFLARSFYFMMKFIMVSKI